MAKVFLALLTVCLIPSVAAPDDVDDVKDVVRAFYQALNDGDAVAAAGYVLPGADEFPGTGAAGRRFSEVPRYYRRASTVV